MRRAGDMIGVGCPRRRPTREGHSEWLTPLDPGKINEQAHGGPAFEASCPARAGRANPASRTSIANMQAVPYRRIPLGPRTVVSETRADGTLLVRSTEPLASYPRSMTDRLAQVAQRHPARLFLA